MGISFEIEITGWDILSPINMESSKEKIIDLSTLSHKYMDLHHVDFEKPFALGSTYKKPRGNYKVLIIYSFYRPR
jgi:hypothetical protein